MVLSTNRTRLIVLEEENIEIPPWLDAEFLFRINYGPATLKDAQLARKCLNPCYLKRYHITLLDRWLGACLHRALYKMSSKMLFLTDWIDQDDGSTAHEPKVKIFKTPFDYPASEKESEPIMWCEEFVVNCVWDRKYSSAVLGSSRPPMAAVVLEIIEMVNYLSQATQVTTVLSHLRGFNPRWTVSVNFDRDWGSRGYLLDMFRIVIARRLSQEGWDRNRDPSDIFSSMRRILIESTTYPGCESLRFGKAYPSSEEGLHKSLDNMKASFINSGPFRLELTTYPWQHLTLSSDGKIMMFWEGMSETAQIPGSRTLMHYKAHTLGRLCWERLIC